MYRKWFSCFFGFLFATEFANVSTIASRVRRALSVEFGYCGEDTHLQFASSPSRCYEWTIKKTTLLVNRSHPINGRYEGYRDSQGTLNMVIRNTSLVDEATYQHVCDTLLTAIDVYFECVPKSVNKIISDNKHLVLSTNVYPEPERITVHVNGDPTSGSVDCNLNIDIFHCTWISASSLDDVDGVFELEISQTNYYTSKTLSGSVKIVTPDAPSITDRVQLVDGRWVIRVTENSRADMECVSRGGIPAPTLDWHRDTTNTAPLNSSRTEALQKDDTYIVTQTYSFTTKPSDDGKVFICRSHYPGATTPLTQGIRETSVRMHLNLKPKRITVSQTNKPVSMDNVTIVCMISKCRPAPDVTWTYKGQTFTPDGITVVNTIKDEGNNTISLVSALRMHVTASDNGQQVACHVNSIALEKEMSNRTEISVQFPVRPGSTVILGNRQIEATGSKPLDLNCTTGSSNPASTITWRNGSTVIPNNNPVHRWTGENRGVVSSQILRLTPTPHNDGDVITCVVTNSNSDVAVSQGDADTDSVTLKLKFLTCPASEYNGLLWKEGYPGRDSRSDACPVGYSGFVTRYCGFDGVYHDPVYNCTNRILIDIDDKDDFEKLNEMKKVVTENNQSTPMYAGDLETLNNILRNVTNTIPLTSKTWKNASYDFINIVNSVLGERTTETWTGIINNTGSGVEATIHTLDLFVEKLTETMTEDEEPIAFAESNLFLHLGKTKDCMSHLEFPGKNRSEAPEWARSRVDSIQIPCDYVSDMLGQKYSGSMYRDVSKHIPTEAADVADKTSRWTLNGPLLGFSLFSNITKNMEVTLSFQIYDTSLGNPKCSYWKLSNSYTGSGNWSTDGCRLQRYSVEEGIVVCICDHLTNFAILMSPADTTLIEEHRRALGIISLVGCIISMISLVLTIAVYIFFWRQLVSERSVVLINLCLTLFVGYLVFLPGINQTSNEAACTAVSVLLHYIFLVVFCLMLAQGIMLGTRVLLPFSRKKLGCPLTIVSYVVPVLIVGISMTATKLNGYGNEKCCWLDVDTGLVWAFLAPVLLVILINGVIIVVGLTKMLRTTAMEKKTSIDRTKAAFKGFCVLFPVMGVTWILGIFSVNSETVIFQYLFSVFNSLQGLLILIFNCILDKKVQMAFRAYKIKYVRPTEDNLTTSTKAVSSGRSTTDTGL